MRLLSPTGAASSASKAERLTPARRLALRGALGAALALGLAACGGKPRRRPQAKAPARSRGDVALPQATPRQVSPIPPTAAPLDLNPEWRESTVARAMFMVNAPYTYGGNTPEGGFDCSGLVSYAMKERAELRLPRTTAQWAAASRPIDIDQLQRGDLVFFNTSGVPFSHMGIYIGNGQFVHAPSTGGVVRVNRITDKYFADRYMGARTVFAL